MYVMVIASLGVREGVLSSFFFFYTRGTHTSGDRQAGRMKGGLGGGLGCWLGGYRVLLVGWLWDFGFPGLSGRVSGRLIG